ncbi:MAG: FapA family protein [Planctomycetota bacterium]|jgi:uncharacterized protein (DUF342 family)|nr:FapA family protein [Planctomycetota bacterium]
MAVDLPALDVADCEIPGRGGKPLPARTLLQDRTPRWEIHAVCSLDRLRVFVRLLPGPNFSGVTSVELADILKSCGVIFGLNDHALVTFAAAQSGGGPFSGYFQLARGQPMNRGENGSLEFHVQPSTLQPRYDQNASGNIDFKQLNLIENCFAGQRVASILPPGPGRAGRDVFGCEIPPEPGSPMAVEVGSGVTAIANGREFSADTEGRLIYENGVIGVSQILEIGHDVDLRIGNIDFVGRVVIRGALPDGFYITGKQGVTIHGHMGAARITSEGDVRLAGGVKGKNAAIITCRNLDAHYIDEAVVEAMGHVTVDREIVNSNVKSLGRVTVAGGAIVGGLVCGFGGVEAETVGSELGVSTRVLAGLDWNEENLKDDIRGKVTDRLELIQSADLLLGPLFADPEIKSRLGNEQKSVLFELISELRELRDELRDMLLERASLGSRDQTGSVGMINVSKRLHQGTDIYFPHATGSIMTDEKGPLSVVENREGNKVVVVAMRPLPPLAGKPPAAPPGEPAES